MIQNYDNFSKQNITFGRIYTLENFHIYSTICDISGQLCVFLITSCKRFHSKQNSYEKMKRIKKGLTIFY
jgi:hypothetical protein